MAVTANLRENGIHSTKRVSSLQRIKKHSLACRNTLDAPVVEQDVQIYSYSGCMALVDYQSNGILKWMFWKGIKANKEGTINREIIRFLKD